MEIILIITVIFIIIMTIVIKEKFICNPIILSMNNIYSYRNPEEIVKILIDARRVHNNMKNTRIISQTKHFF